jgi:phage terminase large subunit-like protein
VNNNKNQFYLNNPSLPTEKAEFDWTPEMVVDLKRCKRDIVYFAEKFFYIVNLDRGKEVIKLYKAQKRILKSLVKNDRVVLLSSRQAGKTTLITIFALWYTTFNDDKTILIVGNKEKTAIEILGRIRLAYEMLPNWIKSGIKDYSKTNIVFANDSRIFVSTTASSAGRGGSINCLLIDECVHGNTKITIKNKITNEIKKIKIKDFLLDVYK